MHTQTDQGHGDVEDREKKEKYLLSTYAWIRFCNADVYETRMIYDKDNFDISNVMWFLYIYI